MTPVLSLLKQLKNRFSSKSLDTKLTPDISSDEYVLDRSLVGQHCKIGKGSYLYNTVIGDFTYLSSNVSVMNSSVGKFCSIGQGVSICLGMHPASKFVSTHPAFFSLSKQNGMTFSDDLYFEEMGNAKIGNDVWIGVNAVIMDNINIGDGAIIGAGAVVTKNVPPYAVVVGIPAQVLRYRFEKDEIEFLIRFKWWEKDEEWLKINFKDLHDINTFKAKYDISG